MGIFSKKTSSSTSGSIEFLLVGLGNPDKKYENTRHNAGFMALDAIASAFGTTINRSKFKALTADITLADKRCLLLKPTTYMNLSGQAVVEAMNFYKIPIENVIVFYDDISLEPGRVRIRRKGSDGGHNGIKNIIYLTGQDTFPRIKIGVGKKPHPDYDLADWVLSSFGNNERKEMDKIFSKCPEIARLMVTGQVDKAMNECNS